MRESKDSDLDGAETDQGGVGLLAVGTLFQLVSGHLRRRMLSYLLVISALAMGFIAGSIATRSVDPVGREEITSVLATFFAEPTATNVPPSSDRLVHEAFTGDILRTAVLMWVLGLSVIGAPVILVITFFRGFALGFTTGFMVEEMSWQGGVMAAASLLPHNLFSLMGLVIAGAAGLMFAGAAGRILLGIRTEYTVYGQFASSAGLTVAAAVLILSSMFVEAYVTPVLINVAMRYIL